jgi:hypothetical protein
MEYFQTENSNFGKFWRVLQCKMLVYVVAIWYVLRPFGIHMLWPFGIFLSFGIFPFLVCCNKKDLATQDGPDLLAFTSTTKG